MGNWFNGLDLGVKYAIALSCLFVLVMAFACTKLYLMKRKQKKWLKEHKAKDSEEAGKMERVALTQREEGEGDLFGIRALEKGFTGGVAQSRPTTPSLASRSTLALSGHIPYGQPPNTTSASSSTTMIVDSETISKISSAPNSSHVAKGTLKTNPAVDMALNVPDSPRGVRPQEIGAGPGIHTSNPGTPLLGPSFTSPELFQEAISPRIHSVVSSSPVMHRAHSGTPSIVSEHYLSRSNTPDIRGDGSPSPPPQVYSPQGSSKRPVELYDGPSEKYTARRTRSPTEGGRVENDGYGYLHPDRTTQEPNKHTKTSQQIPTEIDSAKPREPSWPLPEGKDLPSVRKLKRKA